MKNSIDQGIVLHDILYLRSNKVQKINSNMTCFKRFDSKPVVKVIFIYDRLRHR
jgi:hypothetical protein